MSALRNQVQLIGRLGQDPEVKNLENDRKLTKFTLATSEVYRNSNDEKVEDTQWHNIVIWGKLAAIAEKYLVKGKEIAISGKLVHRTFEDKGVKKYFTEIVANDMVMLSSPRND